jgi:hypothetical protein
MNKKILSIAVLIAGIVSVMREAGARPEFVIPTGATGCKSCHLDDFGGGFKQGILEASVGGIPGLKAFLHPTPVKSGDTKPVLHPINEQWDITVGEVPLVIPLIISDAEDDVVAINMSKPTDSLATKGAVLSPEYTDTQSNLPVIDFKWQPTAAQANQTYTVNFTAQEKSEGRKLLSNSVTATIHVWPARKTTTKHIKQFKVQRVQWLNNKLSLEGIVVFKDMLTAGQRATSLKTLTVKMRTNSGFSVGSLSPLTVDAKGNWQKTVPFKANAVPCTVKLNYEGLNATSAVKLAPVATCLK